MQHHRLVSLDGPMNFRDLGGYQNSHQQTVKWNKIYRADALDNLSHHDLQKLAALNVTVDCDLRSGYEQAMAPDHITSNIKYLDCHVYPDQGDRDEEIKLTHPLPESNSLGVIYQHVILNIHSLEMFKRVMQELLHLPSDQALVFHCSAGKDRTGMVSALILSLLGVDEETIIRDYLLTNGLYDFAASRQLPSDNDMGKMVAKMNLTKGDGPVMKAFLDTINAEWGSAEALAKERFGFSDADVKKFRAMYLE